MTVMWESFRTLANPGASIDRYDLSKQLATIIAPHRAYFQTDRSDFVTVESFDTDTVVNYHVYFTVSHEGHAGLPILFVTPLIVANRKVGSSGRAIKFLFILHNTMNRIPIKN